MSRNLDYHDMWHELHDCLKIDPNPYAQYVAAIMEEMDPRLKEEEEMAKQVAEAVKTFMEP